jgi:hypothetical protein
MNNSIHSSLQLTMEEANLYNEIFMKAKIQDTEKTPDILSISAASKLMMTSQLGKEDLSVIWRLSVKSSGYVSKPELFLALKLIALQQNGLEISPENVSRFTFYPKLEDNYEISAKVQMPQNPDPRQTNQQSEFQNLFIADDNLNRIEAYIETKCQTTQKGILTRNESHELLRIGKFSQQEASQLWEVFDFDHKDFLNRGQLIALLYYISLKKNNQSVPFFIPPKIMKFIQEYNKPKKAQELIGQIQQSTSPQVVSVSTKKKVDAEDVLELIRKITAVVQKNEVNMSNNKSNNDALIGKLKGQVSSLGKVSQELNAINSLIESQIKLVDECQNLCDNNIQRELKENENFKSDIIQNLADRKKKMEDHFKVLLESMAKTAENEAKNHEIAKIAPANLRAIQIEGQGSQKDDIVNIKKTNQSNSPQNDKQLQSDSQSPKKYPEKEVVALETKEAVQDIANLINDEEYNLNLLISQNVKSVKSVENSDIDSNHDNNSDEESESNGKKRSEGRNKNTDTEAIKKHDKDHQDLKKSSEIQDEEDSKIKNNEILTEEMNQDKERANLKNGIIDNEKVNESPDN